VKLYIRLTAFSNVCECVVVLVAALYVQVASQSVEKCYTVGDNEHCFKTNGLARNGHDSRKTWTGARNYCEKRLKGSYSLVAVDDPYVQIALDHFMDLSDFVHSGVFIWLGITQTTRERWSWIDGTLYTGLNRLQSTFAQLHRT